MWPCISCGFGEPMRDAWISLTSRLEWDANWRLHSITTAQPDYQAARCTANSADTATGITSGEVLTLHYAAELGEDDWNTFFSKIGMGYNYQYTRNNLQLNCRNGCFSEGHFRPNNRSMSASFSST